MADRLERPGLALEAEAKLEDAPLALGERVERPADALAAKRLLGLVERVGGVAVGEEVAQLALVVGADVLVQRDGRVRRAERLVDVLDREAGGLGELLLGRLAAELDLEAPRRADESFCWRSTTCTGTRIVRAWFATARCTDWRIHQVAYVENLKPRRQSNFSTARFRPSVPSWIRSRNGTPRPR